MWKDFKLLSTLGFEGFNDSMPGCQLQGGLSGTEHNQGSDICLKEACTGQKIQMMEETLL